MEEDKEEKERENESQKTFTYLMRFSQFTIFVTLSLSPKPCLSYVRKPINMP